jgi:hypothetical protein
VVGLQHPLAVDALARLEPPGQVGPTSLSESHRSVKRDTAISMAGSRSFFWNGLTR